MLFARVEWELINKWNKFHVTSNQIPSVLNCFDIFCFLLQWLLCESAMSQINFISQILILPVTVRVTSRCLATVNVSRRVTPRSVWYQDVLEQEDFIKKNYIIFTYKFIVFFLISRKIEWMLHALINVHPIKMYFKNHG